MRGESLEPGKIGIGIGDAPDKRCLVMSIADPSPAKKAGIQAGDIIIALNGQPVGDRLELLRRISDQAAGQEVAITIERGESETPIEIRLTLAKPSELGTIAPPGDEPA